MNDDEQEQPKVLRDIEPLYVNLSPGPGGIQASTVVRDRATGRVYEIPGGRFERVTTGEGRASENGPVEPRWVEGHGPLLPLSTLVSHLAADRPEPRQHEYPFIDPLGPPEPPEQRACRERADDEQAALGALAVEECEECGEDLSGGTSHYHCPVCREVCSAMGHDHTATARDLLTDPTDGED